MQHLEWMDESLCRGKNADFWFPPMEEANPSTYYKVGKSVCHACPVWKDCLEYAQNNEEVWGCWGGLTPQERRSPHKIPHGTVEKLRLGCSCKECKRFVTIVKAPPLAEIPNMGDTYDIDSLIFLLSNR